MKYFVTADVHGFYNEWMQALKEKQFDINNPEHKLVVCGDLFDRGTQPKQIQAFAMEMLEKDKIILIRGNHEDLALELIENYVQYMFEIKTTHHYYNGTFQTILELTGMNFHEATTCLLAFKQRARQTDYIRKIIPQMKDYFETSKYIFVHGWIPLMPLRYEFNKDWRNADKKLWEKARWLNPVELYNRKLYPFDKTLVLGHYSASYFWENENKKQGKMVKKLPCYEPFISKEVICLDAHTVSSKKVNVIVLDD